MAEFFGGTDEGIVNWKIQKYMQKAQKTLHCGISPKLLQQTRSG